MNTDVAAWLWLDAPVAEVWLREAATFFGEVEAALSRFRPDSELSRLNAAAGAGPQPVSKLLCTVLALALQAADESGGMFDPTVLNSLRHAGYDRSFERLAEVRPAIAERGSPIGWQGVILDKANRTATLPHGLGVDLGGIAKGWTVDRAAEMLGAWGAALVDAGGDIRASAAPGDEPWPIAIENPFDPTRDLGVIRLAGGAVATSSIGRRRWQQGDRVRHHLIDPRIGEPSQGDLHTVTVVAPTTVEAEVAAKVALILGSRGGQAYLAARDLAGLLVQRDGTMQIVGPLVIEQLGEA